MKNILFKVFFVLFLIFNFATYSIAATENSIKFLDKIYVLTYSVKAKSGGFLNEYTLKDQNVNNWTEMVAVHHFPNAKYPLAEAKEVSNFVTAYYAKQKQKAPISLLYNDKKDSAMIDFLLPVIDKNTQKLKYFEFNVFKYEKNSEGKGVKAIQYSKKIFAYELNNDAVFQDNLVKIRQSAVNAMTSIKIPDTVNKEIK